MFKKMLAILLLVSIFYTPFVIAESIYQGWQGEWGHWVKDDKGNYRGESLSIFDCRVSDRDWINYGSQFNRHEDCKVRYAFDNGQKNFHWFGRVLFKSNITAVTFVDNYNCEINLSRVDKGQQSEINIGTGIIGGTTRSCDMAMPGIIPLRSQHLYPDSEAIVDKYDSLPFTFKFPESKKICYTDNSSFSQIWCNDPELNAFEMQLSKITRQIDDDSEQDSNLWQAVDSWDLEKLDAFRQEILEFCKTENNVNKNTFIICVKSKYQQKIADLQQAQNKYLASKAIKYQNLMQAGDSEKSNKIIENITGVYKKRRIVDSQSAGIPGENSKLTLEDVLEIVQVAKDAIYFRFNTDSGNANGCSMYGLAKYKNSGDFLYSDHGKNGDKECVLKIIVNKNGILFKEALDQQSCQRIYCSALHSMLDGTFFKANWRRNIRYMDRLKNSREYKESIETLNDN